MNQRAPLTECRRLPVGIDQVDRMRGEPDKAAGLMCVLYSRSSLRSHAGK